MSVSGRVALATLVSPFALALTLAFALVLLGAPWNRVRADEALIFPHGGDAALRAEREASQRAVTSALGEQGFAVRPAVSSEAGTSHEGACREIGCAPALLAALSAELAVAVAVWKGAEAPQVNVTLVDLQGSRYHAVAGAGVDGAAAAAQRALLEARGLQLLGPGPWVEVSGSPAGAAVSIDGKLMGPLPYRAALSSGDHVLEVKAAGYAPQQLALRMPLDPTVVHAVEVELVAGAGGASAASMAPSAAQPEPASPSGEAVDQADRTETVSAPSVWNYVLGGVAIAGGIALATVDPVRAAARDGECANDDCTRVYAFGTDSGLKIAAGAALAGAGVVFMIWAPLRVHVQADAQAVTLQVRARL